MYTREVFEKYAVFDAVDIKLHEMIPQRGVRLSVFPPETKHNAIWDYAISPQGRHFFSLCAEIACPDYVHFYEYFPETGEMKLLWKLNDSIITYDRAIRPSKVHTSMSFLPDGRIIMATHTTAGAPAHPTWMPIAYYYHLWEGYPGSNVIVFDPDTGKVEDLGIPVPHETIYGGIYDDKTNAYYFSGYIRGHVYRLDLSNRHVTDYGQATEFGSFRLVKGLDGHIYFSSKSGRFNRINTDTLELEDLGLEFPVARNIPITKAHNQMVHAVNGPDGKLYMLVVYNDRLFAYNYKTCSIEDAGEFIPEEFKKYNWYPIMHSMDFDKYGVLWYCLRTINKGREFQNWLVRWDILNGGNPENLGLAGTPERGTTLFSEMYIRDDVLYGADTNHLNDPPAIFRVDLQTLREDRHTPRLLCRDPYHYIAYKNGLEIYGEELLKDAAPYYDTYEENARNFEFLSRHNTHTFSPPVKKVVKLWKQVPIEESRVNTVWFDREGNIHAICGKNSFTHFIIRDGVILSKEENISFIPDDKDALAKEYSHLNLPSHPGREYLAMASAVADLKDGRKLIGTRDGLLAIVKGDNVFSLGPCAPNGPVHQMAATSDGSKVYGVAGDQYDLGMIFTYDDENGVRMLGRICFCDAESGTGASCEPYCIDVSPDGKRLAIGVVDRLGCVYEFHL